MSVERPLQPLLSDRKAVPLMRLATACACL